MKYFILILIFITKDIIVISVPEPLDGGSGESCDLASELEVLLARDGQLCGLDLLDDLGWLGLTHHVQERVGLGLAGGVHSQQGVFAIVFVANLKGKHMFMPAISMHVIGVIVMRFRILGANKLSDAKDGK